MQCLSLVGAEMKNKSTARTVLSLVLIAAIQVACGSKKSSPQTEQASQAVQANTADLARRQGLAELHRVHDAIDELRIIAEGAISQDEFSRRFTDSLLKIGDLETGRQRTLTSFSGGNHSSVEGIYGFFQNGLGAYRESKRFFGGAGTGLGESDYSALSHRFPLMPGVQSES